MGRYVSQALTKTVAKYGATQLEILSIIYAIENLRGYIEMTRFTVVTDFYALRWLSNLKHLKTSDS